MYLTLAEIHERKRQIRLKVFKFIILCIICFVASIGFMLLMVRAIEIEGQHKYEWSKEAGDYFLTEKGV